MNKAKTEIMLVGSFLKLHQKPVNNLLLPLLLLCFNVSALPCLRATAPLPLLLQRLHQTP